MLTGTSGPTASSSSSTSTTAPAKQKRVLPTRTRRGGPGIGTCDADLLILDTLKRRSENEPLVPASTCFLLTTNSALISSASDEGQKTASPGKERYFDRPEVLRAVNEQKIIQTPSFERLAEGASVGSRLRTRSGSEDQSVDTSDAAYEKRHRKFETFEKRQRLREKEKLKHEQYKLKERIEQLRAMDITAFMALPATAFPPRVLSTSQTEEEDPLKEGERRRQELLSVALGLEERYATLLPSERKTYGNGTAASSTSSESQTPEAPVASTSSSIPLMHRQALSKATAPRPGTRTSSAPVSSASDGESRDGTTTPKLVFRLPPSKNFASSSNGVNNAPATIQTTAAPKRSSKLSQTVLSLSSNVKEPPPPPSPPPTVDNSASQLVLMGKEDNNTDKKRPRSSSPASTSTPATHVHARTHDTKRARQRGGSASTSASISISIPTPSPSSFSTHPTYTYIHTASSPAPSTSSHISATGSTATATTTATGPLPPPPPRQPGALMAAALHAQQTANTRKTSRGQKPFGCAMPQWPMEEYVLPEWVRPVALARLQDQDEVMDGNVGVDMGMGRAQDRVEGRLIEEAQVQMQEGTVQLPTIAQSEMVQVQEPSSVCVLIEEKVAEPKETKRASSGKNVGVGKRKGQKDGSTGDSGGDAGPKMMDVDGPILGSGGVSTIESTSSPFLPSITVLGSEPVEVQSNVRRMSRRKQQ